MVYPSNFLYSILKINIKNDYVYYSLIICPITWTSSTAKKTLSHFPYLGFEMPGHRTKAVRFWAHKRARPTSCKIKRRNYSIVY